MAENDTKQSQPRPRFLPEDILINILLRLRIASCIFRFRCVCKSWRILLSDPNFIRKILFFQTPADQQSLRRLLITGGDLDPISHVINSFYYSLHSYHTLRPTSAVPRRELPSAPDKIFDPFTRLVVQGCCDGVFCISDVNFLSASDIILWNPTTSETKSLPGSTCPYVPNRGINGYEFVGFGFDPLAGDYKVVRALKFVEDVYDYENEDDDDYDYVYCYGPGNDRIRHFTYKEVYSLKNDSWKTLADTSSLIEWMPRYVRQDTSRNEKCYWYYSTTDDENFYLIMFDMSREVFEYVTAAAPPHRGEWCSKSCFMVKEAFVTTFDPPIDRDDCDSMEVWGLMKYRASRSWIKMYSFRAYECYRSLEVWKEGMFICSRQDASQAKETDEGVFVLDPATGETTGDRIEIRGRTQSFEAHAYTPTQVSLSELE